MEAIVIGEDTGVFGATGTVTAIVDGVYKVWTSDGTLDAKRAVSCLIAPENGDLVLLTGSVSTDSYVLAVLERPGRQDARISTGGDLTLELQSGRFTVAAARGVDLISQEAVSLTAARIEARARQGSLFFGSLRVIAGAVDSTLDRLSQSVKRVFRRVEELDHLRAGQIDYASESILRLHGENTLMTARELVKADGKQIHIG